MLTAEDTEKQNARISMQRSCPAGTYNSYGNAAANAIHHDAHTDCKVCTDCKIYTNYDSKLQVVSTAHPVLRDGSVSDGLPWTGTNHLVADSVDDCVASVVLDTSVPRSKYIQHC